MAGRRHNQRVIVLGAGPAGCAAAIGLTRAGANVVVFEQKAFPRNKVCGGCLSGTAVELLRGLLGSSVELPGVETRLVRFVLPSARAIAYRPRDAARIALRSEMDAVLAAEASRGGAEVRFGVRAELANDGGHWAVKAGGRTFDADYLLVAGGLGAGHAALGLKRDPPSRVFSRCARSMIGLQWLEPLSDRHPAPGCVEMHWLRGGYVGLATCDDRCCNVAMALDGPPPSDVPPVERLRRQNPAAPVWSIVSESAAMTGGVKGVAYFPSQPLAYGCDNVLLVGDAAGYAEPFTGEGMGLAMRSAAFAVQAIMETEDALHAYTRALRRFHAPYLKRCLRIGSAGWGLRSGLFRGAEALAPQWVLDRFGPAIGRLHASSTV